MTEAVFAGRHVAPDGCRFEVLEDLDEVLMRWWVVLPDGGDDPVVATAVVLPRDDGTLDVDEVRVRVRPRSAGVVEAARAFVRSRLMRRRGLEGLLLDRIVQVAATVGFDAVVVRVDGVSPALLAWCVRRGFSVGRVDGGRVARLEVRAVN